MLEPTLHYDNIGSKISMSMSVDSLSSRDKVILLNHLMDVLGITDRCYEEMEGTKRFREIWQEQADLHWR